MLLVCRTTSRDILPVVVIVAVDSDHCTLEAVDGLEQNSSLGWVRVAGLSPLLGSLPEQQGSGGDARPWIGCSEWMSSPGPWKFMEIPPKFGVLAAWRKERPSSLEEGSFAG